MSLTSPSLYSSPEGKSQLQTDADGKAWTIHINLLYVNNFREALQGVPRDISRDQLAFTITSHASTFNKHAKKPEQELELQQEERIRKSESVSKVLFDHSISPFAITSGPTATATTTTTTTTTTGGAGTSAASPLQLQSSASLKESSSTSLASPSYSLTSSIPSPVAVPTTAQASPVNLQLANYNNYNYSKNNSATLGSSSSSSSVIPLSGESTVLDLKESIVESFRSSPLNKSSSKKNLALSYSNFCAESFCLVFDRTVLPDWPSLRPKTLRELHLFDHALVYAVELDREQYATREVIATRLVGQSMNAKARIEQAFSLSQKLHDASKKHDELVEEEVFPLSPENKYQVKQSDEQRRDMWKILNKERKVNKTSETSAAAISATLSKVKRSISNSNSSSSSSSGRGLLVPLNEMSESRNVAPLD